MIDQEHLFKEIEKAQKKYYDATSIFIKDYFNNKNITKNKYYKFMDKQKDVYWEDMRKIFIDVMVKEFELFMKRECILKEID
jgi:hypothetical protein